MALWKGLPASMILTAVTSGIRFGCQSSFNSALATSLGRNDFRDLGIGVRVMTETAGGFAAGVVLPFVFTPLELVKCRQQAYRKGNSLSAFHIIQTVWKSEGLRGLYVGHSMTMLRSTIGNASLFGSYELFKHIAGDFNTGITGEKGETPKALRLLCGVLAGWVSWYTCFPLDSVKTRLQTSDKPVARDAIKSTFRQLYREKALYKGIAPVLMRAIPVHAAYLPVYDFAMTYLLN